MDEQDGENILYILLIHVCIGSFPSYSCVLRVPPVADYRMNRIFSRNTISNILIRKPTQVFRALRVGHASVGVSNKPDIQPNIPKKRTRLVCYTGTLGNQAVRFGYKKSIFLKRTELKNFNLSVKQFVMLKILFTLLPLPVERNSGQ